MPANCAPTPKKPTRRFADGGAVSKADQLMAEMAAKYGVTGQAQAAPAPQPAPQPQPKAPQQRPEAQGIIGVLKGRAAQIDKAAGYAGGGKIEGPGTATSDSIPAEVRETGENIKVSTDERILSKAQDAFLGTVAKNAGYESLDAMLEDGTGKPVGPTMKAGKRAAEDGLPPELDPFANRGRKPEDPQRIAAAIAAPPTLGSAPFARTEPAGGALSGPASGITRDPFGPHPTAVGNMTVDPGKPAQASGRDANGIITDDSAAAASGLDMQRPGGISGTYDGKGVNDILARENKARGELIDGMIAANGGNGVNALPDNPTLPGGVSIADWNARVGSGDDMRGMGSRTRANYLAQQAHDETLRRGQDLTHAADMARAGLTARGLDARDQTQADRLDLIRRGQDIGQQRVDATLRGQDLRAEAVDKRIAAGADRRGMPTMAQERGNAEIDAESELISGLTPEEIKRKSSSFTATGRENPEYDESIFRAAKLANRRKIGDDAHFDERQQRQSAGQHGYDRAEVAGRFRSERGMDGYKLGNDSENGVEVLDSAGKVVGHYR